MLLSRLAITGIVATILVVLPGCASIMDGRTADVTLRSTPSDAQVTVRDAQGVVVAQTTTPGEVKLKRNRSWLRPARYTATFEKEGFEPTESALNSKLNPWLVGNVILGGPIGLGVDAATGAIWRPQHSSVELPLVQVGRPQDMIQMASANESDTQLR